MEIFEIVGFALVGMSVLGLLRRTRADLVMPLSLVMGIGIFFLVADKIAAVFALVEDLASLAKLNVAYFTTVLKVIGVAYVTEFSAQVCRDADESALGSKVEFAGKVLVLLLTVPIVRAVMQAVISVMG